MRRLLVLAGFLGASLAPCVAATNGPPTGWFMAGSKPQNYRSGADANGTAFLQSKPEAKAEGFGTMMQTISADEYKGRRVRFSATVRSENLAGWAGLWMRVDEGAKTVSFDNMQTRSIKGTTDWTNYEVVLDVPKDATNISFGVLVDSSGEIWLRGAEFEPVGAEVPTTGAPTPQAPMRPVNLDFRQ